MSKKTLYLIGIGAAIAICIVMVINVYDMKRQPDLTPTPAAATAAPKAEKVTAAMVANMIDGVLKDNFPYSYQTRLNEEQKLFNVDIWSDEINADSVQRTKESGDFTAWNNMVRDILSTTVTMQDAFNNNGHSDIVVVVSLCDPGNRDLTFLTIADGVAGYDVVNDIDLLNK